MGSALNSVFGGGGILGAALNIGSMFFPPLAIANGLGNMLGGAIGGAIGGAVDQLSQQCGLPKFIGSMVKDVISNLLPGMQQPCDKGCADHLQDKCGDKFRDFQKGFMEDLLGSNAFKNYKSDCEKSGGAGKSSGGGKSWFVALMQALGEVQNKQAAKVQQLSKEVSELLGAGNDSKGSQQAQFDKMEEFKAEAKLQEVFANVTKSIGDAIGNSIATVARAQ